MIKSLVHDQRGNFHVGGTLIFKIALGYVQRCWKKLHAALICVWQVRDRATLYLNLLGDGPEAAREDADAFLFQGLDVPLANLEASLQTYVSPHGFKLDLNSIVPIDASFSISVFCAVTPSFCIFLSLLLSLESGQGYQFFSSLICHLLVHWQ